MRSDHRRPQSEEPRPRTPVARWTFFQGVLWIVPSWYIMMSTHEFGHLLAGWLSVHQVTGVRFPLVGFSETLMDVYPRPLWVAVAGFVSGALLPVLMAGLARRWFPVMKRPARFIAGFCLLANGAYLALGWIERVGDIDELLRHGTPVWPLIVLGFILMLIGRGFCVGLNTPSPRPPDPCSEHP